ncbi:MAG: hypothetical protein NZ870_00590, partial [bacterium]|nr:hypothetical protein [bacterium]
MAHLFFSLLISYELSAEIIVIDTQTKTITAQGNVILNYQTSTIKSENINFIDTYFETSKSTFTIQTSTGYAEKIYGTTNNFKAEGLLLADPSG